MIRQTLSVLGLVLLCSSCGFEFKINENSRPITGSVPSLAGKVVQLNHNSFHAYAATCTAKVTLLALDDQDQPIRPGLATAVVRPDGSFTLEGTDKAISGTLVDHLLEVTTEGLCDEFLQRPLTDPSKEQIITPFTTLLSYAREANLTKRLVQIKRTDMEKLMEGTATFGSLNDAFTELTTNRATVFNSLFEDSPQKLTTSAPTVQEIVFPGNIIDEGSVVNAKITVKHWDPSYNVVFQWKLDGEVVSTTSHWNYTPNGDSSGPRSLEVYIGVDNGNGQIDTTEPYHYFTKNFQVRNNILPKSPTITTDSLIVKDESLDIRIQTGAGRAHCDSFSSMAITVEETAVPVVFPLTCDSPNIQVENVYLSSDDGVKKIRLWVRDHEGVISSMPSELSVTLDKTAPLLSFTAPTGVRAGGTVTEIPLGVSDLSGVSSFKLHFSSDGVSFTEVATLSALAASYNYTLPAVDTSSARLRLTATDLAGNSSTLTSEAFSIDSTSPGAPSVALASASPTNSTSASFTIADCTDRPQVLISTSATKPLSTDSLWESCNTSVGGISKTLSTGDGTKTFYFFAKDEVGNVSSASSAVSIVLDQTPPSISLTAPAAAAILSGLKTQTISWTSSDSLSGIKPGTLLVEGSSNGGSSWDVIATDQSTSGSYTWTPDDSINTTTYRIRLTLSDEAGNTNSAQSGNFTVDSGKPTVSSLLTAGDQNLVLSNIVALSLSASDNLTHITDFCFKYNYLLEPTLDDSCWRSIKDPVLGLTSSKDLELLDYYFALGFSTDTYQVRAWVRDQANNISEMSASGVGTQKKDVYSVTYKQPAPIINEGILVTSNPAPDLPLEPNDTLFNSTYPTAYIRWKLNTPVGNSVANVTLEYTVDEENDSWSKISDTLIDGANGGCTPDSAGSADNEFTGCFVWSSPPHTYFRLRIKVTDAFGAVNITSAQPSNTSPFEIIAGNLDMSIGGDARTTMLNYSFSASSTDPRAIAVAPNGIIYYRDVTRGILKLEPTTGTLSVFIKSGGSSVSTLNAVARTSVSLTNAYAIDVDGKGNLYIWDRDRIHKWDPLTDTVTTIIGGGANTEDTIEGARNLAMTAWTVAATTDDEANHFDVLSNGDIIFKSSHYGTPSSTNHILEKGGGRLRYFDAKEDKITSIFIKPGFGSRSITNLDTSRCRVTAFAYTYNPDTLEFGNYFYSPNYILHTATGNTCELPNYGYSTSLLSGPSSLKGGVDLEHRGINGNQNPPTFGQGHKFSQKTGKDGKIYWFSQDQGVRVYDPQNNTFTLIYGTGVSGYCEDGEEATKCAGFVTDVFVTRDGRVFVADAGRVRTIDEQGYVRTIFGQSSRFGDDMSPLAARIGNADFLRQHPVSKNIYIGDRRNSVIRKFSTNSNMSHVAGNSSFKSINKYDAPATEVNILLERTSGDNFDFYPGTEDLIASQTSTTYLFRMVDGFWTRIIGSSSESAVSIAEGDGKAGNEINLTKDIYLVGSLLGVVNNKIIIRTSNGNAINSGDAMVKAYDTTDSYRQSHIVGKTGTTLDVETCAYGTPVSNCALNQNTRPVLGYLPGTNEYLITDANSKKIFRVGATIEKWAEIGKTMKGVAIDSEAGLVYFCGINGSTYRPFVFDVATETNTLIPNWPAGYDCTGSTLLIDDSGAKRRLIMPVSKAGATSLMAVGAIYVD